MIWLKPGAEQALQKISGGRRSAADLRWRLLILPDAAYAIARILTPRSCLAHPFSER